MPERKAIPDFLRTILKWYGLYSSVTELAGLVGTAVLAAASITYAVLSWWVELPPLLRVLFSVGLVLLPFPLIARLWKFAKHVMWKWRVRKASQQSASVVTLNRKDSNEIGRFLENSCGGLFGTDAERDRFGSVVSELIINALRHGDAEEVRLVRYGQTVTIADDGDSFDPTEYSSGESDGAGLVVFKRFVEDYESQINVSYWAANETMAEVNELRFSFLDRTSSHSGKCVAHFDQTALSEFSDFISFPGQYCDVPVDCEGYELNLLKARVPGPYVISEILRVIRVLVSRYRAEPLTVTTDAGWLSDQLKHHFPENSPVKIVER